MKRKDLLTVLVIAIVAGLFSLIIASLVFSPKRLSTKVPVVDSIDKTFPDIKNDPSYTSFLNPNALDLTQPVQIGNNQNKAPFIKTSQ